MKSLKMLLVVFFLLSICSMYAQTKEVGKIYTKEDADNLYGPVQKSIKVESSLLKSLTQKTENYMMFIVKEDKVVILGDKRKVLYPSTEKVNSDEVAFYYSVSKINELLDSGQAEDTYIEARENVMSLTNGLVTLEFSTYCPPFCD